MKYILSALAILIFANTLPCEAKETPLFDNPLDQHILVNNRVLVKVNDKAISVVDLMKKMDLQFYRQFPQYTSSPQARFQYYQAQWKHVLNEMIDKELILVDAEESKIEVSAGDVRQEMEEMFGPNIIANLDKAGLTFNEAYKMVKDDIILRRMLYFRIQLKAIQQTTPQRIRDYYNKITKDYVRDNEWVFSVVTIRHRDAAKAAEASNLVHRLLVEDKVPLTDLTAKLKELNMDSPKHPSVTISEEFHTNEKELSDVFKKILVTLTPDSYSLPLPQKSRSDNNSISRIFYLKAMNPGGPIPYHELEPRIKAKLIDDSITAETEAYFKKQRQHFDIQEAHLKDVLNSDFQPFILQ